MSTKGGGGVEHFPPRKFPPGGGRPSVGHWAQERGGKKGNSRSGRGKKDPIRWRWERNGSCGGEKPGEPNISQGNNLPCS